MTVAIQWLTKDVQYIQDHKAKSGTNNYRIKVKECYLTENQTIWNTIPFSYLIWEIRVIKGVVVESLL